MMLTRCLAAVCLVLASALHALAQTQCNKEFTYNGKQKTFLACTALTVVPGISIAWTQTNSTLEVGFTGTVAGTTSSWLAWGINPSSTGDFMPGAGVIIAQISADSLVTMNVSNLGFGGSLNSAGSPVITVNEPEAEFSGTTVKIYASIDWAQSSVFHGWNSGRQGTGGLQQHPESQQSSKGMLNLATGVSTEGGSIPREQLKYNHGILAVVSWGILIPLGIMVARYARPFEACRPGWFYTHICFQVLGFTLGVIAWGIGIKLGKDSVGLEYDSHRNIGIVVFTFSILQVLALVLRPNVDNKSVRPLWNVYHHSVGYSAALLAIVNVFLGFHILKEQGVPKTSYRNGYIAVLAVLGGIAFVLEVFTWMVYFKRRSQIPAQKMGDSQHQNGRRPNSGYV